MLEALNLTEAPEKVLHRRRMSWSRGRGTHIPFGLRRYQGNQGTGFHKGVDRFFATGLRGTVMPTAMFTVVAGNNQSELDAPLESWSRLSETRVSKAAPTIACSRAPGSPPSARPHRGVIAITAIGTNGHCSAGSQTSADRNPAAVARIMGNDLGRGGVSVVGARLNTGCIYFTFRGRRNFFTSARCTFHDVDIIPLRRVD